MNIGCAGEKDAIERATKLLELLTEGKKTVVTTSKKRSTFGIPKARPVGVKVTLRGEDAMKILKISFAGIDNRIKSSQFTNEGNFNFGVKEYIEMPGIKYQHEIGMMGFDVTVNLKRLGFSIKRRKIQPRTIPQKHRITKQEAIQWVKDNFEVDIVEE